MTVYECPRHGLLDDDDVFPGVTRDEGYCMRCGVCNKIVEIYCPESLAFEWTCTKCGWSGFDPEVELNSKREIFRVCPKCGEPE